MHFGVGKEIVNIRFASSNFMGYKAANTTFSLYLTVLPVSSTQGLYEDPSSTMSLKDSYVTNNNGNMLNVQMLFVLFAKKDTGPI